MGCFLRHALWRGRRGAEVELPPKYGVVENRLRSRKSREEGSVGRTVSYVNSAT